MAIYRSRLPKEYQEVEYIESTGTQYIDTLFKASRNTKAILDFQQTLNTTTNFANQIFGARESSSGVPSNSFMFGKYQGQAKLYFQFGNSSTIPSLTASDLLRHIATMDNNGWYLDGTLQGNTASGDTLTNPFYTLKVFGCSNGVTQTFAYVKIFALKIYKNNILVRNFVPCYRKVDNVIGLYDMVNDVFYTNAGSGTFLKGNNKLAKVIDIYKGTTQIIKKYKGNSLFYHRLPSEFQQVEHIQSTGSQYIDSGVNADSKLEIKTHFSTQNTTSVNQTGAIHQINASQYTRHHLQTNNANFFYGYSSGGDVPYILGNTDNNKHYIQVLPSKIIFDNNETTFTPSTFDVGLNYWLFARNSDNMSITYSWYRIYDFKMIYNGTLVRNFMPCYRKADGVIGLYDLKNDVFYTNAGTGTFLKGNDVL